MNEALQSAVEAYLAAEDVELDDLSLKGGGKARILKVVVDDAPEGIRALLIGHRHDPPVGGVGLWHGLPGHHGPCPGQDASLVVHAY